MSYSRTASDQGEGAEDVVRDGDDSASSESASSESVPQSDSLGESDSLEGTVSKGEEDEDTFGF